MNDISCLISVKTNLTETPLLHADVDKVYLTIRDKQYQIPDSTLVRWQLRAHFPHLRATSQGRAWYLRDDPMDLPPEIIAEMSNPAKPYQLVSCARMLLSNCALWLDMGLGKTFVTLLYFLLRYRRDGCKYFVVICPTTVFGAWQEEAAIHLSKVPHQVVIAHGTRKRKLLAQLRQEQTQKLTIIVTSYETLASIANYLELLDVSGIVFDEASKIKNHSAKRTKSAQSITRNLPNASVHLLSGTPSSKNVEGYYPLYEILGPRRSGADSPIVFRNTYVESVRIARCRTSEGEIVFIKYDTESDYENWARRHCPRGSNQTYWQLHYILETRGIRAGNRPHISVLNCFHKPIGTKNLDQLHQITLSNAYCLKKEEVAKDLPSKTNVVRSVEMSEEIEEVYHKFKEENHIALRETRFSFTGTGNPHLKLHQIANGFFYDADGQPHWFEEQPKITELLAILEEAGDQKIVIWSPFRPQIKRIHDALTEEKIEHILIHGDVPPSARAGLISHFRTKPECKCLVANPDVAGMGLTLVESHLAVVMTNWYKADVRAQLIDRLHRIGQHHPVTVVDLVSPGTLEPHILRCLKSNLDIEGEVLTGAQLKGAARDHRGDGQEARSTEESEVAAHGTR